MGQPDGEVAIVTRSGRGIGQQAARRLARDGAAQKLGGLHVIVNNAGYTWDNPTRARSTTPPRRPR